MAPADPEAWTDRPTALAEPNGVSIPAEASSHPTGGPGGGDWSPRDGGQGWGGFTPGGRIEPGDVSTVRSRIPAICLHHATARAGLGKKVAVQNEAKTALWLHAAPVPPPPWRPKRSETPRPRSSRGGPRPRPPFPALCLAQLYHRLDGAWAAPGVIQRAEPQRRSGNGAVGGAAGPPPAPGWHRWVPLVGYHTTG